MFTCEGVPPVFVTTIRTTRIRTRTPALSYAGK
nr:MAG TPA: hypothetical protein [Caudoviricetes sp.]